MSARRTTELAARRCSHPNKPRPLPGPRYWPHPAKNRIAKSGQRRTGQPKNRSARKRNLISYEKAVGWQFVVWNRLIVTSETPLVPYFHESDFWTRPVLDRPYAPVMYWRHHMFVACTAWLAHPLVCAYLP